MAICAFSVDLPVRRRCKDVANFEFLADIPAPRWMELAVTQRPNSHT